MDTELDCAGSICAPPVQDINPVKVTIHPGYDARILQNDIALIKLAEPANIVQGKYTALYLRII